MARELSMSLVQGRRRGWSRRHFTHHMALALGTLAVRARCTRGCSLHLGRNVRRSLHTISLKFLYGGGDRTGAGSRSRLDKRRPHVPPRLAQISRDEALLPVRQSGCIGLAAAAAAAGCVRPRRRYPPARCMHVHRAGPLHPNQYHTLSQKTDRPTRLQESFTPPEPRFLSSFFLLRRLFPARTPTASPVPTRHSNTSPPPNAGSDLRTTRETLTQFPGPALRLLQFAPLHVRINKNAQGSVHVQLQLQLQIHFISIKT